MVSKTLKGHGVSGEHRSQMRETLTIKFQTKSQTIHPNEASKAQSQKKEIKSP
jgi:hypothetical protein